MGLFVTLQHNGEQDLRGCMIMQSTTWPWRAGVSGCRLSNLLQSKRTWRIRESCLRLVSELFVTVCDAITGFNCDWCSSVHRFGPSLCSASFVGYCRSTIGATRSKHGPFGYHTRCAHQSLRHLGHTNRKVSLRRQPQIRSDHSHQGILNICRR